MKYILVSIHKSAPTEKSGFHRQYRQLEARNSTNNTGNTIYTNKSKFINTTLYRKRHDSTDNTAN